MSVDGWVVLDADGAVTRACGAARALFSDESARAAAISALRARSLAALGPEGSSADLGAFESEGLSASSGAVWRHADGGLTISLSLTSGPVWVPPAWERRFPDDVFGGDPDQLVEAQRAFMLAILDADPNLIFVKDRNGHFVFVNESVAALFGAPPESIIRQPNAAVHEPEDEVEAYNNTDREVLERDREIRLEERFTMRDGAPRVFDTRKRPLRAPDGERYILGISVDITERLRMSADVEELKERLEMAVDAGRLGLWDWNCVTDAVYFSPTWKEQLGFEESELENSFATWVDLLHDGDRERALAELETTLSSTDRTARYGQQFRMRTKSGGYRWVDARGHVLRDEAGEPLRIVGYHADITKQKEAEAEQLRRADELAERSRLKDQFLANMSHELRTPLNAVLGQAEALTDGIFGSLSAAQSSAVETIATSGEHLLSLINDVLDVAKIDAGRLELDMRTVDIDTLCQDSLRLVREAARRKNVRVAFAHDGVAPAVRGDTRRLRQVLLNLLANAIKFTPEGGRVGLEVLSGPKGATQLVVWDTGIGIPNDQIERLFEPFVQLDAGLARRHEGSGLGLALARRIVSLHEGTIAVESRVSQGSRFIVTLPAIDVPSPEATRASPAVRVMRGNEQRVLIVDDNERNVEPLRHYLRAHGYRVEIAHDGLSALRRCAEERPDAMLLDIQMPDMDGMEVLRRLRASEGLEDLYVLALTALAMPGDRERCLEAGADDYMSKPVSLRDVLGTLGEALRARA